MSSGRRKPLLMPVGVQSTLFSAMRYEWLPSLPAQNPFCQIRRPMSHICSFSANSPRRWVPLPLVDGFVPYAMSDLVAHHRPVQNRRAVRVDRHALLRVEGHARLAALGEGDQLAVAGAEVVVDDNRLARPPRPPREHVAVLHLDDEEPPAHERVVEAAQADPADHFAYPHDAISWSCLRTSSGSSCFARTNREIMFFICCSVRCGYSITSTFAATCWIPCSTDSRQVPRTARSDGQRFA